MASEFQFWHQICDQEASFTNMTKFQGIFISQKMTLLHHDKQGPLTCVAIAAGKNCDNAFNGRGFALTIGNSELGPLFVNNVHHQKQPCAPSTQNWCLSLWRAGFLLEDWELWKRKSRNSVSPNWDYTYCSFADGPLCEFSYPNSFPSFSHVTLLRLVTLAWEVH